MKQILILILLISCSTKQDDTNKYILIIETASQSILTNSEEIETQIDSFYAKDAVSAFDSAALEVYGIQVADSILRDALQKNNNETDYKYYRKEIMKIKILDHLGNDISTRIPDSTKRKIYTGYGIKPFS